VKSNRKKLDIENDLY